MQNTAWVSKLKGQRVVVQIPAWLARQHGFDEDVHGDLRAVTDKAIGLDPYGTGDVIWLPLSKIVWIRRL